MNKLYLCNVLWTLNLKGLEASYSASRWQDREQGAGQGQRHKYYVSVAPTRSAPELNRDPQLTPKTREYTENVWRYKLDGRTRVKLIIDLFVTFSHLPVPGN